ncbi:MAG: family 43 glycosylhydrolase [Atopobiaceae bacterium]
MRAENPVLRGWHPDPCICKGPNGVYCLVVSTFQWLPGVSLYTSRDLIHWESRGGLLSDLDLSGIPDSAGIWAPDLTYADGRFWLVYTIARQIDGIFKDVENYVTTAPSIEGPWSEPMLLNVSGFDPGLYHEDGHHYVLNPQWDPRPLPGHRRFNGLILQEFDGSGLVGEARKVLDNGDAVNGLREGPHIMTHDGWYYLACAEGGTGRRHRIRMARSKSLWGPYEVCPEPLVCAWESDSVLRKAGHGNLFEGPDGEWYVCHLCSRYLPGTEKGRDTGGAYTADEAGLSPLGREAAIQRIVWEDGWPRLAEGGIAPKMAFEVDVPEASEATVQIPACPACYETDFTPAHDLAREEWLIPRKRGSWLSQTAEGLLLKGHGSPSSLFAQALLARRQTAFSYAAECTLEARPHHYLQHAGLICLYDTRAYHYLALGYDEKRESRVLQVLSCDEGTYTMPLGEEHEIVVPDEVQSVHLAAEARGSELRFLYAFDGGELVPVSCGAEPLVLDASILSDEHQRGWAYTGAMVGLIAVDEFDRSFAARFRQFRYEEREGAEQ